MYELIINVIRLYQFKYFLLHQLVGILDHYVYNVIACKRQNINNYN